MYNENASSVIDSALAWVGSLLFGTIGTMIAVIAIAMIGVALLQGRIPMRRGASVVIGCFILFSAKTIATGIASEVKPSEPVAPIAEVQQPSYVAAVPPPAAYDPYAGAAVPVRPRDDPPGLMVQ